LGLGYVGLTEAMEFAKAGRRVTGLNLDSTRIHKYPEPYVPRLRVDGRELPSMALDDQTLRATDGVLIVTDHRGIEYNWVVERACSAIDTRNATRGIRHNQEIIVKV